MVRGILIFLLCGMLALAVLEAGSNAFKGVSLTFGAAVLLLLFEIRGLRQRIELLEGRLLDRASARAETDVGAPAARSGTEGGEPSAPVVLPAATNPPLPTTTSPFEPSGQSAAVRPPATESDRPPPGAPSHASQAAALWPAALVRWLTGGNPVVKIGLLVIFLGVTFLFKYAAQRNLAPIEYRFLAAAAGAVALIAWGFRLRRRHLAYSLSLQGGGVGLLYLTIFAAARLYSLIPWSLAFVFMLALVGLSSWLAILQNARSLAMLAAGGGFLTPILIGRAQGGHVTLFFYYALLNCGILAVAWFKSWRGLNLIGFVCTFSLAACWGINAYQPAYFASTEPFLLFHLAIYALVAIAHAHSQPRERRGYIDGALVFGAPLAAATLQAPLVADYAHGMAFSAFGFAAFYLLLTRVTWRVLGQKGRALSESFLAIAVVFLTVTIPLALSNQWISACWALEGAALVWVGVRQRRKVALLFGLGVQLCSGINVLLHPLAAPDGPLLLDPFFLGALWTSLAGLVSHYHLGKAGEPVFSWQKRFLQPLALWALAWWLVGGGVHLHATLPASLFPAALLFHAGAGAGLLFVLNAYLPWPGLWPALCQLPLAMPVALGFRLLTGETQGGLTGVALLADLGWLAWPFALLLYGLVLRRFDRDTEPKDNLVAPLSWLLLWILLFLSAQICAWLLQAGLHPVKAWTAACWGLAPAALLFTVRRCFDPAATGGRVESAIAGTGTILALAALQVWTLCSLLLSARPEPLPYIPLLNPLELAESAVIALGLWLAPPRIAGKKTPLAPSHLPAIVSGLLAFLLLNGMAARLLHAHTGLAYTAWALCRSATFQAMISLLWAGLALAMAMIAARKGWRWLWLTGAVLLTLVVLKLFLLDLAGVGTIGRIVSFLGVGLLMLFIGFFAPPPSREKT